MIVYRICNSKYAKDISGESSRKQESNRWNSKGTPMLYTSESPALCAVEIHQYIPPSFIPLNYSLIEIEIPDTEPLLVDEAFFKEKKWIDDLKTTQAIGDYFVDKNEFLILKVPSAMVSYCWNYLMNPNHKDFNQVKILKTNPFPLTGKLFTK